MLILKQDKMLHRAVYNKTTKFSWDLHHKLQVKIHYNNRAQQALAQQGVGSFQPFLQRAETQAQLASGLGKRLLDN